MIHFKVNGKELLNKIEELIREGNVTKIIVKDDKGNTYIEIPIAAGVLGAVFAPVLTTIGALAGMAANYTIEVIRKDNISNENNPGQDDYMI
jgi:hypothetical protein